jgi:CysZ protein
MTPPARLQPLHDFSTGFHAPFAAFRFLRNHRQLIKYIFIPFAVNVIVFSLVVYLSLHLFKIYVAHHIPQGEAWYWFLLNYFAWFLAILLTAVLTFFSFTVVGTLIASPFNDILSEQTERILTGTAGGESFDLIVFLKDAGRVLIDESRKMLFFVSVMLLLLLLNLIPVAGSLLYPVFSTGLVIFFLAIEYTGYVFSRKHLSYKEQRTYILHRKSLWAGFGLGLLLMLAIPFLQFLCIPLGVIGATRLYFEGKDERHPAA